MMDLPLDVWQLFGHHGLDALDLPAGADQVELVSAIPRTSVGKFDKKLLRAQFSEVTA
jgi:non-ribosomal peptide synthetase component E (peptide arylation enzyme)